MSGGLTIVRAEGDPKRRGRAIGTGFADQIGRSIGFYGRYFERRGLGPTELTDLVDPFLHVAEAALPDEVDVIRGMAGGADVPFAYLFAANAFEELEPLLPGTGEGPAPARVQRCSAFSVVGPGVTLLGHNEQWLAGDAGCAGVVEIPAPDQAIAIVSPTVASWRPAVGMNSAGAAQAVMSVTASDDGMGVPRVLVSRHALEASTRADALRRTALRGRSGGYAYLYAFAGEAFTVETTRTRAAVLDGSGAHTNHYLDAELAEVGSTPSRGSVARLERLRALLEERMPRTSEEVMVVLGDHASDPGSICLHADPAIGEESETVLFSMVCDLEASRMWVATGNPCETAFEEVDLGDVI